MATIATLCTDKAAYDEGDIVQLILTVENALDEQIVLDGGEHPVMDICIRALCFSHTQSVLTRLVLDPGRSHIIQWELPTPDIDLHEIRSIDNVIFVTAGWIGIGGQGIVRDVKLDFSYGERRRGP